MFGSNNQHQSTMGAIDQVSHRLIDGVDYASDNDANANANANGNDGSNTRTSSLATSTGTDISYYSHDHLDLTNKPSAKKLKSGPLISMGDSPTNQSLFSPKVLGLLSLWYFFSFTTLFLNKYILTYKKGDPTILGSFQLLMCALCGYIHLRYPWTIGCFTSASSGHSSSSSTNNAYPKKPVSYLERNQIKLSNFTRSLVVVGSLRFSTILLGLIALWFVPVSFAETVKSTAPVFTVVVSRILLGEQTNVYVNLSLLPVMGGLALCSAFELSFTLTGFIASMATNLSECLQNVYSKRLLNIERYEAVQLQFYTAVASIIIQIPCIFLLVNLNIVKESLLGEDQLLLAIVVNGISFHCQSLTEYMLLNIISPVTHSVANTAKRALLIWLSVLVFGNPLTILSWVGTGIVLLGVILYSKARQMGPSESFSPSTTYHYSRLTEDSHDV